jgi:hypothetical protein
MLLLQMCPEAADSLGQLMKLTVGQLELLPPHTASMLTRPLAASAYLDPPRVSCNSLLSSKMSGVITLNTKV